MHFAGKISLMLIEVENISFQKNGAMDIEYARKLKCVVISITANTRGGVYIK